MGARRKTNADADLLERWRDVPEGTPVYVRADDGAEIETVTRSAPWALGHGQPVIKLQGIVGGYALERVRLKGAE